MNNTVRTTKALFKLAMSLKSYRATVSKGDGWALMYERIGKVDGARDAFENLLGALAADANDERKAKCPRS